MKAIGGELELVELRRHGKHTENVTRIIVERNRYHGPLLFELARLVIAVPCSVTVDSRSFRETKVRRNSKSTQKGTAHLPGDLE